LSFPVIKEPGNREVYGAIHQSPWNEDISLNGTISLRKEQKGLLQLESKESFNLVYYDAFGPTYEPELWTMECMEKIYGLMVTGGVLVSYCAQGQFRRNLQTLGFEVERLAGPLGKWEMIRAYKV
jgi:tRNA U34 5-methylaminomethyl-2-thiouridine-forming methyltransferase MnmC